MKPPVTTKKVSDPSLRIKISPGFNMVISGA